jgi:hypothetical protein
MVTGGAVEFWESIFLTWWEGVFVG